MDFSPAYLVQRFFYRLADFFHHWYIDGSRTIGHSFINTLASIDRSFAVKITLQHLFEPLYNDYSVIGRILGFPFRLGRVAIGSFAFLVVTVVFATVYVVWLAIPAAIIIYAIRNR